MHQARPTQPGATAQSCSETLVKALFRPLPRVLNARTTTTASTPAITPYSKAVTARRSVLRVSQVLRYSIMVCCPLCAGLYATCPAERVVRAGFDAYRIRAPG